MMPGVDAAAVVDDMRPWLQPRLAGYELTVARYGMTFFEIETFSWMRLG